MSAIGTKRTEVAQLNGNPLCPLSDVERTSGTSPITTAPDPKQTKPVCVGIKAGIAAVEPRGEVFFNPTADTTDAVAESASKSQ